MSSYLQPTPYTLKRALLAQSQYEVVKGVLYVVRSFRKPVSGGHTLLLVSSSAVVYRARACVLLGLTTQFEGLR